MDWKILALFVALACLLLSPSFVDARWIDVVTNKIKSSTVPAYFVFGDSLVDVGENNYLPTLFQADFPPYGETFFHKPTGRFTNGRNIGDFLAQGLGLPFAPPYLQPNASFTKGINFASAGSGLLDTTNPDFIEPINAQLEQYKMASATLVKQLGAVSAENMLSKSLFLVSSGSNDLDDYLMNPALQVLINATVYITVLIEEYENTLMQLYDSGARKAAALSIPPLGCAPSLRISNPTQFGECLPAGNQLAIQFNAALKKLVEGIHVALPTFNLVYLNSFDLAMDIINHGDSYGITNVSAACCGAGLLNAQVQCGRTVPATLPGVPAFLCDQPSEYFFWDFIHPTEHVVGLLFEPFWSGGSASAYPINLKTLAQL